MYLMLIFVFRVFDDSFIYLFSFNSFLFASSSSSAAASLLSVYTGRDSVYIVFIRFIYIFCCCCSLISIWILLRFVVRFGTRRAFYTLNNNNMSSELSPFLYPSHVDNRSFSFRTKSKKTHTPNRFLFSSHLASLEHRGVSVCVCARARHSAFLLCVYIITIFFCLSLSARFHHCLSSINVCSSLFVFITISMFGGAGIREPCERHLYTYIVHTLEIFSGSTLVRARKRERARVRGRWIRTKL